MSTNEILKNYYFGLYILVNTVFQKVHLAFSSFKNYLYIKMKSHHQSSQYPSYPYCTHLLNGKKLWTQKRRIGFGPLGIITLCRQPSGPKDNKEHII